jgi:ADP-ribose pyrophosphatase
LPPEPDEAVEVFHGNLIRVVVETWPQGVRETVHHPGAAAIVALDGDHVLMIRQLRQSIRSETVEIPAGILDREEETPAECAARELEEETGYRAQDVEPLGVIHTSPGFTDERIELFTARAERKGQPEEGIAVVRMPFEEALAAARDGRITDAKSMVALLLAANA